MCGLPLTPELSDVSPTSLTTGHGINVCNVLNHLADAALKATGHTNKPLVHVDAFAADEQEAEGEDDDEVRLCDKINLDGKTAFNMMRMWQALFV